MRVNDSNNSTKVIEKEQFEFHLGYKEMYDLSDSLYVNIDFNFIIQYINFKAAEFLGRDRRLLLNCSFFNYISEFSKNTLKITIEDLLNKKFNQQCEIEFVIKGGRRRQVQLEASLQSDGQIQLGLIDITANNQNKSLIQSLEKEVLILKQLLNDTEDALATLDENLCFTLTNPSFYTLFLKLFSVKIKPGMYLEQGLIHVSELKPQVINAFTEALLGKKPIVVIENSNYNADVYYFFELKVYLLTNKLEAKQIVFRIRDLTNYKLREMVLHQQQSAIASSSRISTMEEMMSALAHEINQPLAAINTYSKASLYLLQKNSDSARNLEKVRYPLEQISIQSEHAGNIIHSMKKLICNEYSAPELNNINLLIKSTISLLNYECLEIKIILVLDDILPDLMINKIQIMQVILNLARNSIEALQNSKTLDPTITIKTINLNTHIMVRVEDNGPGILLEHKKKILNTYFTTKPQGTGIGLRICRSLVERHGGELHYLETQGGATFYFTLPIKNKINYE